jgi:hypothetical protein
MRNYSEEKPTLNHFTIYRDADGDKYYFTHIETYKKLVAIYGSVEGFWCNENEVPDGADIFGVKK